MKIIVTGGAGFIGSAVCRHLINQTDNIVLNVDKLTYAANLASLESVAGSNRYSFAQVDITDAPAIEALFGGFQPDAVLHLAAESHVDRSIDGPGAFVQTNVVGTYTLLHQARLYWEKLPPEKRESFRFVNVSTDEVYGSLGDDGLFTETTAYQPSSPYSASKAAADHLARAWFHTYGMPTINTNCSNNYGPCHFPEKLIPLTILNALEGKKLPVYGTGANVRDWLYVEDHARALWTVLEKGVPGETYNIGGHNEKKNIDVVRLICRHLDKKAPKLPGGAARESLITFVTDRPGHDHRYAIDAAKIKAELGWVPQETFETGLEKTVDWYLANEAWWKPLREKTYSGERLGVNVVPLGKSTRRVLVLGRDGQVGSALRKVAGPGWVFMGRTEADLNDEKALETAVQKEPWDAVINAAAYTAVDKAENEPDLARAVNATAPGILARLCAARNIPFIHISTDYVFDGGKDSPYTENDKPNPLSVYGCTKAEGEQAVQDAGGQFLILRTSWVYAPGHQNFVSTMLRLGQERAEMKVVSDQTGAPTAAADIAQALAAIVNKISSDRKLPATGIFHLTAGGETTWHAFAGEIFEEARAHGLKTPSQVLAIGTVDYPTPARRPLNSRLDNTKLRTTFGIEMPHWNDALHNHFPGFIAPAGEKKKEAAS